jgi:peptidoglycan LD-endopeptidase LytH
MVVVAAAALGWGAFSSGLVVVDGGGAPPPATIVRAEAAGAVARDSAGVAELPTPGAPPAESTPPVAPSDSTGAAPTATSAELAELRAGLVIPVGGVRSDQLVDSFDDARGDRGAQPDGPRRHDALDILAPRGTPVLSAAGGRVLKLFDSSTGGLTVYAADPSGRFVLLYAHLDRYAPGLAEGASLRPGQTIGYVGTTGNAAPETPHLHFAIMRTNDVSKWWEGTPVNPYLLLRR